MPTGQWWISLDSWVLQDGNYTDFATGDRRQFALEFGYASSKRLQPAPDAGPPRCAYSGRGTWYEVHGQVLRTSAINAPMADDSFVLDIGLLAYKHQLMLDDLEPPVAGDWLDGRIHLAVDHFSYMDTLAQLPDMPPLIYTWTIDEIQLETSPMVTVEHGDPRYSGPDEGPILVSDRSRESWRTIERTQWDLDGSYRLRCTLVGDEPINSMESSGPRSPYGPLDLR